MAALLRDGGAPGEAGFYQDLAEKGAACLDRHLFNGEYYQQVVTTQGLRDTSFTDLLASFTGEGSPEQELLRREGPKYQVGSGCLSDAVLGSWLAWACGLETPQDRANIRRCLRAIFEYNFKEDLWEHANPQRPGYALGGEPGLLLCTWPRGGRPTLPFVYSDEVWTGIEYQAAAHMISAGLVAEGLTIVKAARSRYDGVTRNPWNEYECGSYYARAMSSYVLLSALSGFHYSAPRRILSFGPRLDRPTFKTFFSTASGYGTLTLRRDALVISLLEGELAVDVLLLTRGGKILRLEPRLVARAGRPSVIQIPG
jgi:hypothetical protein